jgi:hypothetical protein
LVPVLDLRRYEGLAWVLDSVLLVKILGFDMILACMSNSIPLMLMPKLAVLPV